MAGLIQQAQQAAPQGAPQPQQGGAPQGGPQPNQQALQRVVYAATQLIHQPQVSQQLLAMMKQAGDPAQALAQATVLIMRQLYEKSKRTIPPDVLGAAGVQVLQLIAELAQRAGLFKITMDIIKQAAQAAMQMVQQQGQQPAQQPAQQGAAPAAPQPEDDEE